MPYTKSLEEIIDYLANNPGIVLRHKKRGAIKILSVSKEDQIAQVLAADEKTGEFTESTYGWSLSVLFGEQELIEPDGVFIFKKPEITPAATYETTSSLSEDMHAKSVMPNSWKLSTPDNADQFGFEPTSEKQPSTAGVYYDRYADMFRDMDSACDDHPSMNGLSKHFWHYCAFETALSIIKTGTFLSRAALASKRIRNPFDNMVKNADTQAVMDKNHSFRVEEYCRFFLRPRNGPSYNLVTKMREQNVAPVLFAINRSALWNQNNKPTLMFYGCAGAYYDEDFDWTRNNINTMSLLKRKDFSDFDWGSIYSYYSKTASDEVKSAQKSEFVVYEQLPIDYIEAIYFDSPEAMRQFVASIRSSHPGIAEKCKVWRELLWR